MAFSRGYGWRPGLPDVRDWAHHFPKAVKLPASVDLRSTGFMPAIWDQGNIGSCTAHGVGAAYSFDLAAQGGPKDFTPSRLFVYYTTRVIEGSAGYDSGATITDATKSLNQYGAPPEGDWPYVTSKFTAKPPQKAYDDALLRQSVKYAKVPQTINSMQSCLAAGVPFVIGFTVYESFESDAVAANGVVPMPKSGEGVLGGHCVLVVGYDERGRFIFRNSWGTGWGEKGYGYMPGTYLISSRLSSDFWTIQQVESPDPAPTPPAPLPPTPVPVPVPPTPTGLDKTAVLAKIDDLRASVAKM